MSDKGDSRIKRSWNWASGKTKRALDQLSGKEAERIVADYTEQVGEVLLGIDAELQTLKSRVDLLSRERNEAVTRPGVSLIPDASGNRLAVVALCLSIVAILGIILLAMALL